MSGDISDQSPPHDDAGIIPRLLHALFERLDSVPNSSPSGAQPESSVKVSFIELYNEELRDLFSADDGVKVKMYDGDVRQGQAATMVQGMEEKYITSASNGLKLLRHGSYKRQVAATKCNDLSSRSHTIFTVTVLTTRTLENGEEIVYSGKLNLVDLAGSENIKRSEAENKRATEAGLINKSLTALGRVINALVDKQKHIPYRESNLTRLLQDSLGGETKTCIIATVSPARSNLQETVSTLNYAFRAKNIRNKPQVNQLPKKMLLKEFTIEIEKLKSELIATRQRNGVYLTQEAYDGMNNEAESTRIVIQEQRDKMETMECNLKNKVQELFNLNNNFKAFKEDNEMTKVMLDNTKSTLEKTEAVLEHTKRSLFEEAFIRKQHQKTEEKLAVVGKDLISTLGHTTADINGLHTKLRRRSELHSINRQHWTDAQVQVSETTQLVEDRMDQLQSEQQALMGNLSSRMQSFIRDELLQLESAKTDLQEKSQLFCQTHAEVTTQTAQSRDEMNHVLQEVTSLREEVKSNVGAGLSNLGDAAQRISAGIMTEIEKFHTQLHSSYTALGQDFKTIFGDLVKELGGQRDEVKRLNRQISDANSKLAEENNNSIDKLQTLVTKEKTTRNQENKNLLLQIQELMEANANRQELRMQEVAKLPVQLRQAQQAHEKVQTGFVRGTDEWVQRSVEVGDKVAKSRDNIKKRIQSDFSVNRMLYLP
jgi:kinesin family protein 11